jgi:hypothetical protein
MPDPLDIFAANLRHIRHQRGLSQERLALTVVWALVMQDSSRTIRPR